MDEAKSQSKQETASEAPPLVSRWLHGGPPLDDLTSIPLSKSDKDAANTTWRSFSDTENKRLEDAWQALDEDAREQAWRKKYEPRSGTNTASSSRRSSTVDKPDKRPVAETEAADDSNDGKSKGYIADDETESQPHIVHVSQDNLFSANLLTLSLYPVFWRGARIGIQRASWFYPSSSQKKFYPVDPVLAAQLEEAYHEIKPFDSSYGDELRSALEIGTEAEAKLKHNMPEVGVDVIFQGATSARIYAKNLPARLSKSFLTSLLRDKSQPGGGTLVYRGYDTVIQHIPPATKAEKAKAKAKQEASNLKGKASQASLKPAEKKEDTDSEAALTDEGETSARKPPTAPSKFSSWFHFGYGSSKKELGSSRDMGEEGDDNTTAEAMEDSKGEDGKEPELSELIIIVHGMGQKLAATYDSFNIVHAVNQLRKLCNEQSKDPAMVEVIGNKRLQFIPLQWRSSLQFDEMSEDEVAADAQLDNRFTLDDIQVQGSLPFVRSLMSGVGMDLAFYLSHHRDKLTKAVIRDSNAIYRLFMKRNPGFKGKVSIIGSIAHSLGTALCADILSRQPTWVPELSELSFEQQKNNENHFIFNTSTLFFLGSPVAYMFFLNRAQLIARRGRARSKDVPKEIAVDQVGRYGCMAIDSLYNVYNILDPIAVCLNACVDADYAKVVKPVPVGSVTSSLISAYTAKVGNFIGSLIPSFASGKKDGEAAETAPGKGNADEDGASTIEQQHHKPQRPRISKRQYTSELNIKELRKFQRAEARMLALNPQGSVDFYLQAEGFSQYYDMLLSHASYWHDPRFAAFVLTQLLASQENLEKAKAKREEEEEAELSAEAKKA